MYLAHITNKMYHTDYSRVYYDFTDYLDDTFSPVVDSQVIDLTVHGKTYAQRKASLEDTAIEYSNGCFPGLSMKELASIQTWFRRNGKRYGLIKEFEENCIC